MPSSPRARCRNCRTPLEGRFCHQCGQEDRDLDGSAFGLVREWLDATFGADARLWPTLRALTLRPGALSVAYIEGQRARFVPPFRLYLIASLLFFLSVSFFASDSILEVGSGSNDGERAQAVREAELEIGSDATGEALEGDAATDDNADAASDNDESRFVRTLTQAGEKLERDEEGYERAFVDNLAKAAILMVPIFALLLQLIFFGNRRPYAHCFIVALHGHAFLFLTSAVAIAATPFFGSPDDNPLIPVAFFGSLVYLFWTLRRVFGFGRVRTAIQGGVLILVYGTIYLVAVLGVALLTLWRLA